MICPITITTAEGRFVYLGARSNGSTNWTFQRLKTTGEYEEKTSPPPGRFMKRRTKKGAR